MSKKIVSLFLLALLCSEASNAAEYHYVRYKNFLIPILQRPDVPANFTATKTSSVSLSLTWGAVTEAAEYRLEQYRPGSPGWQQIYTGTNTQFTADNQPAGEVRYRVRSCDVESICSSYSPIEYVMISTQYSWLDGMGDINIDSDNDGVPDFLDSCADTYGPDVGSVDSAGCSSQQIIAGLAQSGSPQLTSQCLDPVTNLPVTNANCPAAQLDSDGDGTRDIDDSYPYQPDNQCTP